MNEIVIPDDFDSDGYFEYEIGMLMNKFNLNRDEALKHLLGIDD